jgi:hypothetical protein
MINETTYYVITYGTSIQLLNFYIDNYMLCDTIDYIINNKVSLNVFTEQVVKKCFKKKQMMYSLCSSLQKVYMQNKHAQDLIFEVINFLKKENAHQELINLYVIMNEYLEAALEAIVIIKKTEDVDVKLSYYIKAFQNLNEYLNMNNSNKTILFSDNNNNNNNNSSNFNNFISNNNGNNTNNMNNININNNNGNNIGISLSIGTGSGIGIGNNINNNNEENGNISQNYSNFKKAEKKIDRNSLFRLLALLKFQIDVLRINPDIKYTLITDDEEERYKIVQEIIIIDSNLALSIIKEYKLKVSDIFFRATREYILNNNFGKFNVLLEIFNKWKIDGLFQRISENENELWNNILIQAISLIPLEEEDLRMNIKQNIIPFFTDDYYRMYAYYIIDELENAFILALQLKNMVVMQDVKNRAYEKKDLNVIDLVEKYYLQNN